MILIKNIVYRNGKSVINKRHDKLNRRINKEINRQRGEDGIVEIVCLGDFAIMMLPLNIVNVF